MKKIMLGAACGMLLAGVLNAAPAGMPKPIVKRNRRLVVILQIRQHRAQNLV